MEYKESDKKIYVTTDYDSFKVLYDNRDVTNARIARMVNSIQEFGWLSNPIMVNEKMEVIDGQSRLEALKRLHLPVEFVIVEGIGIEECRALNINQKNWTLTDYIDSYARSGIDDYIWLKSLIAKYSEISRSVVQTVALGKQGIGEGVSSIIKRGDVSVNESDRAEAEAILFFISRFSETYKKIGGRSEYFYRALVFLYKLDSVDNERLCRMVTNGRYEVITAGSVEGYITQFEELYNKNLAKVHKVDMVHEFKIA